MSVRHFPKGVIALGFVSMFMDISSEMIHSLLPLFLTSVIGVSALSVGIIEGIAEATAAIVKIFSGAISDFIGKRKPLLLLGYGLAAATRPLFPMADSFSTVLVARFTDRIGKGIRVAPRDALLADITPENIRGSAYGFRQALDTIGSFMGPLIAIVLMYLSADNFRFVFTMAMIPAAIVILVIVFAVKEPAILATRKRRPFPLNGSQLKQLNRYFWLVTIFSAIMTLARFSDAFLILRAGSLGLSAAYAPVILIVMNVVFSLSSWPAGILADKSGRIIPMLAGAVMLVFADIVLARADSIPLLFLGASLWGLHMGLTQGVVTAMVADEAPEHLRGTAFGMFNLISGVAILASSVIAGWLWQEYGPAFTFYAGALFCTLSVAGFASLRYRHHRRHRQTKQH